MNDYERIAAVIRHLEGNHRSQPALTELAEVAGLSESHFHRMFHRWAGITPKDFLQCLTAEFAKQCLGNSRNVLDSAIDSGLSGPGRLHDLLVNLEAASPGEFKAQGAGMEIQWGLAPSPFGECCLGWNTRGICFLAFLGQGEDPRDELLSRWRCATFRQNDREALQIAQSIFVADPAAKNPLKAYVRGTPFQIKVWRALLQIPEGNLVSYQQIAAAIGAPGATRAVGTACGANAIAYLIPCHRVIRETGVVKGYRWGSVRKQALLAWESRRFGTVQ